MNVLKTSIIAVWLVMLGVLVHKQYGEKPAEKMSFASVRDVLSHQEAWMGVYFQGEKVGYVVSSMKRVGDEYEIFEQSLMYLTLGDTKQRLESRLQAATDLEFMLKSFSFSLGSGKVRFMLRGAVDGTSLQVHLTSGGHESERLIEIPAVPCVGGTLRPYLFARDVVVGERYRVPFFDPATMSGSEMVITVEGREDMVHGGVPVQVYRIRESFKGIEATAWVTDEGITLKEVSPLGFTVMREDRETVLSGSWIGGSKKDFLLATAIPVSSRIPEARRIQKMTIKIAGIDVNDFAFAGGRQRLVGNLVTVERESSGTWSTYPLPYCGEAARQYLEPSPLVQSDHITIIEEARRIAGEERDAERVARALLAWVYQTLAKKPTISVPSALEVLDQKAGDCNEHTALYAALARAAGIPTRICAGLLFMDQQFFYHAWPEVYLGTWVAIDPALGQFPADATHVRLVVGDFTDHISILKVVGAISIEIVSYS